jgi:hypothetical protein
VEDLATCLAWALDNEASRNQVYSIGGPEYLSFNQIVQLVMDKIHVGRIPVYMAPPYLRGITVLFEYLLPGLPISVYWLDYLAANRTCALDTTMRAFNLLPGRFSQHLGHLEEQNWRVSLWQSLFRKRKQ